MNDLDFRYAVRQDVKNSSIVREIDRDRIVAMWRWASVLVLLLGVLVFSAWQQFQVLRYGYVIEDMRKQRVAEEETRRHLLLERAVLLRPQRLEQVATERLHLVLPGRESTIVIERVNGVAPPAHGIVASR